MGYKDKLMLKEALLKTNLTDIEFVVLTKKHGLDDKPCLNTIELAQMLNQNEDEIRKINRVAFFKLRDNVSSNEKLYFDRLICSTFKPRRI